MRIVSQQARLRTHPPIFGYELVVFRKHQMMSMSEELGDLRIQGSLESSIPTKTPSPKLFCMSEVKMPQDLEVCQATRCNTKR